MNNPIKSWRRQKKIRAELYKTGTVRSWTVISVGNAEMQKQAPYTVALVEMEDGNKVYGQIVDCSEEQVYEGMKVRSTLRVSSFGVTDEDVITYGLKFVPVS
jgi:uncharacterized OB-fold protein